MNSTNNRMLSLDPTTIKPEDTFVNKYQGKTIWHEVTHRIYNSQ